MQDIVQKKKYEYVILNRAKPSIDHNRVWLVKKKLNLKNEKGSKIFY